MKHKICEKPFNFKILYCSTVCTTVLYHTYCSVLKYSDRMIGCWMNEVLIIEKAPYRILRQICFDFAFALLFFIGDFLSLCLRSLWYMINFYRHHKTITNESTKFQWLVNSEQQQREAIISIIAIFLTLWLEGDHK